MRPTEVDLLMGDPTKARTKLGWKHTVTFDQLIKEMIEADLELARQHNKRTG
jgi:GDPmannose 4,6-dehydratase